MFEPEIVKVSSVQFKTKEEIIVHLSQLALDAGKITDVDSYIHAVLEREETASTAVG
ncbi:PTS sugar transporter subunit IIA, partial [Erysipelatoclostridium ramosum]